MSSKWIQNPCRIGNKNEKTRKKELRKSIQKSANFSGIVSGPGCFRTPLATQGRSPEPPNLEAGDLLCRVTTRKGISVRWGASGQGTQSAQTLSVGPRAEPGADFAPCWVARGVQKHNLGTKIAIKSRKNRSRRGSRQNMKN